MPGTHCRHLRFTPGSGPKNDPSHHLRIPAADVERVMNKGWKSALAVLALAGSALSAPVVAQSYGPDTVGPNTYGPPANPYPPQGGYGPQNNYPPQNNGYGPQNNYPPQDNGCGDPNYSRGYAPDDPYAPPADPYSLGPYASGDPYAPYPNYVPPPGGVAFDTNSGG